MRLGDIVQTGGFRVASPPDDLAEELERLFAVPMLQEPGQNVKGIPKCPESSAHDRRGVYVTRIIGARRGLGFVASSSGRPVSR